MRGVATEVGLRSEDPGRIPGMVIETDRACPKCGYNLRGLAVGQRCPECGRPIFFGLQSRPAHRLADAPYWHIRLVQAALWGLLLSAFAAGGIYAARELLGASLPILMALDATLWIGSIAALALPKPPDRNENTHAPQINIALRMTAVGSQTFWLLAAGLLALPAAASWAPIAASLSTAMAGLGIFAVMFFLAEIAEYIGDSDRGKRLSYMAGLFIILLALAVAGLRLRVSIPLPILGAFQHGVALMPYILVGTGLVALWQFFQLAVSGNWAFQVARREDERDDRLRENFHADRRAGATALDNEPFGGPVQAPIGSMMGVKVNQPASQPHGRINRS